MKFQYINISGFLHCTSETRWLDGSYLMVYRNNAGRLGSGFISVCVETRWLGWKSGLYVPDQYCTALKTRGKPWWLRCLGESKVRLASLVRILIDGKISWVLWFQGLRNPSTPKNKPRGNTCFVKKKRRKEKNRRPSQKRSRAHWQRATTARGDWT